MKNFAAVIAKLAASVTLLACALPANAVEITYEGSTSGSFSDATTASYLSFTGDSFGGTTSDGTAALTDLGFFAVTLPDGKGAITATGSFILEVYFTAPSGASTAPIVATVAGTIKKKNANSVEFDFGLGQTINYSGVDGTGSFFFAVNDASFRQPSQTVAQLNLTGSISNAVFNLFPSRTVSPTVSLASVSVPEPGSLALLGLGLVGLGMTRRLKA